MGCLQKANLYFDGTSECNRLQFLKCSIYSYCIDKCKKLRKIKHMDRVAPFLSDLVDLHLGHSFRQSLTAEPVGKVHVVTVAHGDADVLTVDTALPAIAYEGNVPKLQLAVGDVLFRPRGTSTHAVYVESVQTPCIFAAPLVRMRVLDLQLLDSRYLQWVLNSPQVQRDIQAQARGSMIRMVSLPSLRDIVIPLPSIRVQRQILEVARLQREERALSAKLIEKTQLYAEQVLWVAAQENTHTP